LNRTLLLLLLLQVWRYQALDHQPPTELPSDAQDTRMRNVR
jgi:hypothetical protein